MRKLLLVVIMVVLSIVLAACGSGLSGANGKALQSQVASDIAGASEAYQCVFAEKALDFVGTVKASDGSGNTIYVYRVAYTYDCTVSTGNAKAKGKGDVFYFVLVDKNGKIISIS